MEKRRRFLQKTSAGFLLTLQSRASQSNRPNILFITTDQQHARLMSCAGDPYLNTPNLDALAADGVRFENAYAANPVCVPSRYSMISGYMPHVFDGLETNRKQTKEKPKIADFVDTPTMGTLFKEAGYDALYGGKLHVEGHSYYNEKLESKYSFTCISTNARMDLAKAAVDAFKQKRDKPFLMWASFINPHDICNFSFPGKKTKSNNRKNNNNFPLQKLHQNHPDIPLSPLPENFKAQADDIPWIKAFRQGNVKGSGLNQTFGSSAKDWNEALWKEYRWAYRRHMETVDKELGVMLQGLKDAGLEDDTVIVFTSDHGDHDGAHQLTMKRSFYEESANVPLIVKWKGQCQSGVVDSTTLVNNGLDVIPTLCDIAGIKVPAQLQGVSFLPAAKGTPLKREHIVVQNNTGRMLRTAQYKYAAYYIDGKSEEQLFDMRTDRLEMNNLAKQPSHAQILQNHRKILKQWVAENNDAKGKKYLAALNV